MRADAGYTVLEALIAFAILSLLLVALYGAAGTSVRGIARATRLQTIAMLAQSKLDEIAATREPLPETSNGTFANTDVTWQMETLDVPAAPNVTSPLRLQDVKLSLSWPEGFATQHFDIATRHLGALPR